MKVFHLVLKEHELMQGWWCPLFSCLSDLFKTSLSIQLKFIYLPYLDVILAVPLSSDLIMQFLKAGYHFQPPRAAVPLPWAVTVVPKQLTFDSLELAFSSLLFLSWKTVVMVAILSWGKDLRAASCDCQAAFYDLSQGIDLGANPIFMPKVAMEITYCPVSQYS